MKDNYEIIENLIELYEHPDINIKLYIIDEIIKGDFSIDEKDRFLETALKSKNTPPNEKTRIQYKILNSIFDNREELSPDILKALLGLLCISKNIKIVDNIINKTLTFPEKQTIEVIQDILTHYIPELHKTLFFILANMKSNKSFEIILDLFIKSEEPIDINFFKDIIEKKLAHLAENNPENANEASEMIFKNLINLKSNQSKYFLIKEALILTPDSIENFLSFYKETVYKEDLLIFLSKFSEKIFKSFSKKLKTCSVHNREKIFRFTLEIFTKISPEKIYELILSFHSCIKDIKEITTVIKDFQNVDIVFKMLNNPDSEIIMIGLELAKNTHNPKILSVTKKLLKNPDENIRKEAVNVLSFYSSSELIGIYRELLSDPSTLVQDTVLKKLAASKDEKITALLLGELNNENLRSRIINILGEKNLDYYFSQFNQLNEDTREKMAKALIKTSDKTLELALRLCESTEVDDRFVGVKTLSYILPEKQEIILAQFKKMTDDPDSFIRSTISGSLKDINSNMATVILLTLLKDPNKRVRANCIEAFENTTNRDGVIKVLRTFLTDVNNRIRGNAIMMLYKLGDTSVEKDIKILLEDNDKWMNVTGIFIIGELALEKFGYELVSLINSTDIDIKKNVIKAIIKINSPKFKTYIKRLVNDPDSEIRSLVLNYLK
ncbi:MAG: HEAT repeat domain-containing protein [Candidatus Muirbacterium halophilum]|nr:HEAT repeat domain-containing protein [Candidatus Muirbacterium halophilum]MCK9475370.1 HEAT repeat domain-containing protein [Candidatus Muirbacterium halophilum]